MHGQLNVKYIREFVKTKFIVFTIRHLCKTPNFGIILTAATEYAYYKDYNP